MIALTAEWARRLSAVSVAVSVSWAVHSFGFSWLELRMISMQRPIASNGAQWVGHELPEAPGIFKRAHRFPFRRRRWLRKSPKLSASFPFGHRPPVDCIAPFLRLHATRIFPLVPRQDGNKLQPAALPHPRDLPTKSRMLPPWSALIVEEGHILIPPARNRHKIRIGSRQRSRGFRNPRKRFLFRGIPGRARRHIRRSSRFRRILGRS